MVGFHRMKLFSLFYMLMLAVCASAQPSVQPDDANESILQDSLETDLLSKISETSSRMSCRGNDAAFGFPAANAITDGSPAFFKISRIAEGARFANAEEKR